jgi:hypothetical protein
MAQANKNQNNVIAISRNSLDMEGARDARTSKILEILERMPRNELILNIVVFSGFVIVCMGAGGIIGAITAHSFGEDSAR